MGDYVIVGAGSAGCVLAEKLSTRHSVTVIEAGGTDKTGEVAIPAAFTKLFKTSRDWNFDSEADPATDDRSLYIPRGKMLGGSSSMNAMLYIRGRPSDFDGWSAAGADGWDWATVLPVFKRLETNVRGADEFHGDRGPVLVDDLRSPNPLSRRFVEAAIATGIPANPDFNGPTQEGVGFFQVTQKRGRRWSAADAFLRPALRRPTLEVIDDSLVSKLIIEKNRVVGVEFLRRGRVETAFADAGVILAAGAIGSPHILELSGIGDPNILNSAGIPTVLESPAVGQNFQDHPVPGVIYHSTRPGTLDDAETPVELARWLLLRRGRLTSPIAEGCAFVRSSPGLAEPDLQFHFGPANFENHGLEPYAGHGFSLGPVLVNPKSRGTVHIRSADPTQAPAIRPNALAATDDVEALIAGVELAREIIGQAPFDDWRGRETAPGASLKTHDELESFVRRKVELFYHPVGTVRMGTGTDSVVDPHLKVRGIDGLHVADTSVMPTIISGNTNAATMMIADRAAEWIMSET